MQFMPFLYCVKVDFSAIQILPEINFAHFRVSKTVIFAVFDALNFNFGKFQPPKKMHYFIKPKFRASKNVKMALFKQFKSLKMISHKIRVAVKYLNFHTV